jgi:hypothetical protein
MATKRPQENLEPARAGLCAQIGALAPIDPNRRYSIPVSLEYLDICRARLYQKVKAGQIRLIKDGSRSYVPGAELIRASTLPAA